MIAIAQVGITYHYLHWIPSESGPMITRFGNIKKDIKGISDYKVIAAIDFKFMSHTYY